MVPDLPVRQARVTVADCKVSEDQEATRTPAVDASFAVAWLGADHGDNDQPVHHRAGPGNYRWIDASSTTLD